MARLDDRAVKKGRRRGCFESAGIALFALLLGAFGASTWYRYGGWSDPAGERASIMRASEESSDPPVARSRIRVSVRNGSGAPGAAERVTAFLRHRGFDVVDFGNAERFDHERTVVIDRSRKPGLARDVAAVLQGVPIHSDPDPSLFLDATVVIGRDLPEILESDAQAEPEGDGRRSWADRIRDMWP